MTLTPAYGRDYKSKAAVAADFDADKDFLLDGKPINKSQIVPMGLKTVNIRYLRLRFMTTVAVTGGTTPPTTPTGWDVIDTSTD